MNASPLERDSRQQRYKTVAAVCGLLFAVVIRNAWVCDDAYLTFRTIDNWVHGYGLRWNPLERVQAFSHPLWLFLVAAGYAVTGEPYYTVIVLSLILTIAAVGVLTLRVAVSTPAAIGAAVILFLSKAFVDFSTSGLEHPLTYLLLALFFAAYFGDRRPSRATVLAWTAGLLAVTRMDAVLLVMPALLMALWKDRPTASRGRLFAAALPVIAWEVFATIYYGFPLPNAAYSWAAAVTAPATLFRHGALYILDSINLDPITSATIGASLALAASGTLGQTRPIAVGILLYFVAMLGMGGDAMSGRLMAAPLLCAVVAASRLDLSTTTVVTRTHALALLVLLGLMAARHPIVDAGDPLPIVIDRTGIADARRLTFRAAGLVNVVRNGVSPNAFAAESGHAARDGHRAVASSRGELVPAAFFAGPSVHIIDLEGDADPLLARLPPLAFSRAGAALRDLPEGYEDTVASGVNRITDRAIAAYYDRLQLITRGPLWSGRRWREIVQLNVTAGGVGRAAAVP